MYNSEIKNEFIINRKENYRQQSPNHLENFFNKIQPVEEQLGKDVVFFSTQEVIELYKVLNENNFDRLKNYNSDLSNYYKFCYANGYTTDLQNHFKEITDEIMADCINNIKNEIQILTREQIQRICRSPKIKNARDKYVVLALFEGIKGDDYRDVILASMDLFDEEKLIYNAPSGNTYKISKTLIEYARETSDEDTYFTANGKERKFLESEYCIKYTRTNVDVGSVETNKRTIRKIIRETMSEFSITESRIPAVDLISAHNIYSSGKIDYIKQKMEERNMDYRTYIFSDAFIQDWGERHYMLRSRKNVYAKYKMYFESTT